jgi:hypothetical protein
VAKTQRAEIRKVKAAETQATALRFREAVLAAPPAAQRAIAPYLAIPCLRRVVQTLANGEEGDFGRWASNPLVLEHLAAAKRALEDGVLTEEEIERVMVAQVQARGA